MIKMDLLTSFRVNGREIARKIIERLKTEPRPEKMLAAVFAGENSASAAFLRQKNKIAAELGIGFRLERLAETSSQEVLEEKVRELAAAGNVGGIIVQLPLPRQFNRDRVLALIPPKKDIDNLSGRATVAAPTVGAVQAILEDRGISIFDLEVITVVGKGLLVGRPIIQWLERERIRNQELKIKAADIETKNLEEFLKDADLVISGVGRAGLIKPEWLKAGAGVIDFGFPPDFRISDIRSQNSDVRHPASDIRHQSFYTPTPGGTGPILVAKLFENFYRLNG